MTLKDFRQMMKELEKLSTEDVKQIIKEEDNKDVK
jgi:phosphopantothenate synthetase